MAPRAPQTSTFFITVTGHSDKPLVQHYYGVWKVVVRTTPRASSVALAHLKNNLDIPDKESQIYIVRDADLRACQDLCDTEESPGREARLTRHSLDYPTV